MISFVQCAGDIVVAYECLRSREQINITVDTAHVEHILSFQITTVAEAEYLYRYVVVAFLHIRSDVELVVVVGSLCVTYVFSVHPYKGCTVNTSEVKEGTFLIPSCRQHESTLIRTYRIFTILSFELIAHLDVRRIVFERIVYIDVKRMVVSFHFPV